MAKRKCARCGADVPIGKHIYSKYTQSYYCWDLDACDKRAKRSQKALRDFADNVRKELENE
jgi:hypothetical protein